MIGYNAAILLWLAYGILKVPARANPANLLMSQRWNQSLGDLQHPTAADSLIPMFEGMVDRAFSRTNGDVSCDDVTSEPAVKTGKSAAAAAGSSLSPHTSSFRKEL
jgi:hypothetical protein